VPGPIFALGVAAIWVAKTGFAWFGTGLVESSAAEWPGADSYASSGVLPTLLYRYITPDTISFTAVSLGFMLLLFAGPALVYSRTYKGTGLWRLILLLMACSPAVAANSYFIGHYQPFMPAMLTLAVVSRTRLAFLLFAGLAVLANPEQATVAFTCLMILSFTSCFRRWLRRAALGTGIGLVAIAIGQIWLATSDSQSRAEFLLLHFEYGLIQSVKFGAQGVYSWWGPWWLIILLFLFLLPGPAPKVLMLTSSVLLPGLFTVTSADGTRVFVGIAIAVGVALAVTYAQGVASDIECETANSSRQSGKRHTLGIHLAFWTLALLVLPSPVTFAGLTGWFQPWGLGVDLILNPPP